MSRSSFRESIAVRLSIRTSAQGSNPPAIGREAVRQLVASFFTTIKGLKHHLLEAWEQDNTIIFQAEVTYTLNDGKQVTLPYIDVLTLDGSDVKDYKVYIDLAPLL